MLPVHEIIVQLDHLRNKPEHTALERNPKRRRGLSAGGRSGNEDSLDLTPAGIYLVGNSRIFSFVQSLRQIYQLHGMAFGNGLVQRPDTIDPDNGAPV